MTELISKLKQQVKEKKYLSFTDEEFKHLDSNLVVDRIRKEFSGKHLFRLPE
jgi:type IV secretory pathway VirB4 component